MEDLAKLLNELNDKAPWIGIVLASLGGLVVLAQIVVAITPTSKDNEYLEKSWAKWLIKIFEPFAPFKSKK